MIFLLLLQRMKRNNIKLLHYPIGQVPSNGAGGYNRMQLVLLDIFFNK